jgi:acyl-CoA synthetase (AMP-forming)/AMP-acid ligase II
MLNRFLPRESFSSYDDFIENYRVEVPEGFNFAVDVVDAWAKEEPGKRALVWCNDAGDERFFSFGDISLESARAAAAFRRMGIGKGDAVLLLLKRRWQFWIYAPALMRLGAVYIPATTQLTKKDLVYRCDAASVKAVVTITEKDISDALAQALPECKTVRSVGFVRSDPMAEALEPPFAPPPGWPFRTPKPRRCATQSPRPAVATRCSSTSPPGRPECQRWSCTTSRIPWATS